MLLQQRNKYLETSIQTMTPTQLLMMLYDGAIRFCRQGIEAINNNDAANAHMNLTKAQDIIDEFVITLDHDAPIAETLLPLYDYYKHLLTEANIKKSIEPIEEVLGYLSEMKETWMQAAKLANQAIANAGAANGSYTPKTQSVVV
jgi:flagellar secretion chaperone FliS